MKNKLLYPLLFLFLTSYTGYGQSNFTWGQNIGGGGFDEVTGLELDANGNTYVLGTIQDSVMIGSDLLKGNGWRDIFLSKFSPTGDKLWAFAFGNIGWDRGWSMTSDGNGNVYMGGVFSREVDFDPSGGTTTLTSNTAGFWPDGYLAKYNPDGDLEWAKHLLTARNRSASQSATLFAITDMDIDMNGDLIIGGAFWDTVWLAPNTMIVSDGPLRDMFLAKYDSDGNLIWGKQMGGPADQQIQSLATDDQGNIYTTGYFFGTPDFDPAGGGSTLTSAGLDDIFLAKYTPAGALDWVKGFGSPNGSNVSPEMGFGIGTDASGNVYFTGRLLGSADFDPSSAMGNINLPTSPMQAAFTAKFSGQGAYQWAFTFEGGSSHYGKQIEVFDNGDFYLTGEFGAGNSNKMDLDPSPTDTAAVVSLGSGPDIFVAKFSANMELQTSWINRGLGDSKVEAIAANGNDLVVGGRYNSSMLFHNGDLRFSKGDYDMFVLRYGDSPNRIENLLPSGTLKVYSNPDVAQIEITAELNQFQDVKVLLRNIQGQALKAWTYPATSKIKLNFTISDFPAGCYLIELQTPQGREVRKVVFR